MTDSIAIFVNDRRVAVAPGTTAADAVTRADAELGRALAGGQAYLTDGRGIRLAADLPLGAGAIVRVIRSSRAGKEAADGDA